MDSGFVWICCLLAFSRLHAPPRTKGGSQGLRRFGRLAVVFLLIWHGDGAPPSRSGYYLLWSRPEGEVGDAKAAEEGGTGDPGRDGGGEVFCYSSRPLKILR